MSTSTSASVVPTMVEGVKNAFRKLPLHERLAVNKQRHREFVLSVLRRKHRA